MIHTSLYMSLENTYIRPSLAIIEAENRAICSSVSVTPMDFDPEIKGDDDYE